jgi:hypothetical protein
VFDSLELERRGMLPPDKKFTLRVWISPDESIAVLTPSSKLSGKVTTIGLEELPDFVTQSIALLKMLPDNGRIEDLGKRIDQSTFYLFIHSESWDAFFESRLRKTEQEWEIFVKSLTKEK